MQSAQHRERRYLRSRISLSLQEPSLSLIILFPLTGGILLFLGSFEGQTLVPTRVFQSLAIVFAPILFSLALILFAGFVLRKLLKEERHFTFLLQFIFVSGLVSLIVALMLNTRYFYLVYVITLVTGFFLNIDPTSLSNLGNIVFVSIVVPLFEETAKIIGIFYLSKTIIAEKETGKEVRALNNPGFILFSAVVVGSTFTFIETYFYSILGTGIFTPKVGNYWSLILLQVVVRFGSPLHVASTMISAYGLILALYRENKPSMTISSYRAFLPAFILAWALHSAWNYFATVSHPSNGFPFGTFVLFGYDIPQIFLFLAPIIWITIIGLLLRVKSIEALRCNFCNNWHSPPFTPESHIGVSHFEGFFTKIHERLTSHWFKPGICPNCKRHMGDSEVCMLCGSRILYTCPRCYAVIPVSSTRCWKCEALLIPPFESTIRFRKSYLDVFALAMLRLYLISYLASALILLFYFKEIGQDFLTTLLFILILILLSGAFLVSYFWSSNNSTRGLGVAFARIITAMLFLLILSLMLVLNLISILIWSFVSSTMLYLNALFTLMLSALLVFAIVTLLFGSSPLIHPP